MIFALSSVFYLAGQFISVPEDRLAGILGIYSQSHYTTFSGFFTLQCEGFTALFFGLIFKVAAELIREQEMTV